MDLINPIINSPTFQLIAGMIQNLGPFIFLFFLAVIIFCLAKSDFIKMSIWIDLVEFLKVRSYEVGGLAKRWSRLSKRLESPNMADWKLAVIEAESMTEQVLSRMGFSGEGFGDKLKKMRPDQLPSLDNLTKAHQTRNNIVHDPDYRIDPAEAVKVIGVYEKALQELDAF